MGSTRWCCAHFGGKVARAGDSPMKSKSEPSELSCQQVHLSRTKRKLRSGIYSASLRRFSGSRVPLRGPGKGEPHSMSKHSQSRPHAHSSKQRHLSRTKRMLRSGICSASLRRFSGSRVPLRGPGKGGALSETKRLGTKDGPNRHLSRTHGARRNAIRDPCRANNLPSELIVQILPSRIHLFDESNLPGAPPFLDFIFAKSRIHQTLISFVIDEMRNFISARESWPRMRLVFEYPGRQIDRRAAIKRPIALAGQNVEMRHGAILTRECCKKMHLSRTKRKRRSGIHSASLQRFSGSRVPLRGPGKGEPHSTSRHS
jgi:hypothetical protein